MNKKLLDRIQNLESELEITNTVQKRDKAILTALIDELGLDYHAQLYPAETGVTFEKKAKQDKKEDLPQPPELKVTYQTCEVDEAIKQVLSRERSGVSIPKDAKIISATFNFPQRNA